MARELINLRVWRDERRKWQAEAKARGVSMSDLIRDAVNEEIALPRSSLRIVEMAASRTASSGEQVEGCRHGLAVCSVCGVGVAAATGS